MISKDVINMWKVSLAMSLDWALVCGLEACFSTAEPPETGCLSQLYLFPSSIQLLLGLPESS